MAQRSLETGGEAITPQVAPAARAFYAHPTAIVDNACGYAALTQAPAGFEVVTAEFKINLLRPAIGARFLAIGRVVNAGRLLTVCTGALLLGAAGLLERQSATTHHDAFDELAELSPTTTVVRGQRFVRSSDRVVTSAGVSAGMDASLYVVQSLTDQQTHDRTVAEMEWMWQS